MSAPDNAAYVAGLEAALRRVEELTDDSDYNVALIARAALSARPDAPATRTVTVAQLDRWYGKMGDWTCQDELRAIIWEPKA